MNKKYTSWVKRLGQWHIVNRQITGKSSTICGKPMLGNNYDWVMPLNERNKCPECWNGVEDNEVSTNFKPIDEVDLIASGYEWECPKCEELNREIEITEKVICCNCSTSYNVNNYEHATS